MVATKTVEEVASLAFEVSRRPKALVNVLGI